MNIQFISNHGLPQRAMQSIQFGQAASKLTEKENAKLSYLVVNLDDLGRLKKTPVSEIRFRDTNNRTFSDEQKKDMLHKIIEVNEMALKYHKYVVSSSIYNSTLVEMNNGVIGKSVGAEGHQEMPVCAEQGAIADAMKQTVSRVDLKMLDDSGSPLSRKNMPKAQRVFHAGDRLQPCGSCLDWMQAGNFFRPDTEILALHKVGGNNKEFLIDIKYVKDLIPLSFTERGSFSNKPLEYLPIHLSDNAKRVLRNSDRFNQEDLKRLLALAKRDYFDALYNFNLKPRTRLGVSTALLLESGHVAAAPHIELRRSIHAMPDITAFSKALAKNMDMHNRQLKNPKVFAVAYFGVDPEIPRPYNLNAFAHPNWGSSDVIIISIQGDIIKARTIGDYLPYDFHKYKIKLSTRTNIPDEGNN